MEANFSLFDSFILCVITVCESMLLNPFTLEQMEEVHVLHVCVDGG